MSGPYKKGSASCFRENTRINKNPLIMCILDVSILYTLNPRLFEEFGEENTGGGEGVL